MRKVVWSEEAYECLKGIRDHIARDSSFYAARTVERILNRETQFAVMPEAGSRKPGESA
ncbi:MAG: plasmid stabilization system protein ParE [Rhodothermales bacterium]|jgi:plasmid stabilization system protein ParE